MAANIMSSSKLQDSSLYTSNFDVENNNSMNSESSLASNMVDNQNEDNLNAKFKSDNSNQEAMQITLNPPEIKIEIPKISTRDLMPQRPYSPVQEYEQYGYLFNGLGCKREPNKIVLKSKNPQLEEGVKKAKKFALETTVRAVLIKQQQQQQKQQLDLIKKQQALVLMCRIYVGSIFYEVNEETVRSSFSPFGPIRQITMSWDAATNKHKGFAFIEFETPEAAQLALEQMNGALLGGRNIKVGRPSNMPQAQPIIDQLTEEAKNYNRIYVASIHPELSEQDVQSVFEAFGPIKTASLTRDPQTGKHKGFGFIEYTTTQAAHDAISSMNLFDLGGQLLRVGKAVTPPEGINVQQQTTTSQLPTASALAAASITAQLQAQDLGSIPASAFGSLNAQNVLNQVLNSANLTQNSAFSGFGLPSSIPTSPTVVPNVAYQTTAATQINQTVTTPVMPTTPITTPKPVPTQPTVVQQSQQVTSLSPAQQTKPEPKPVLNTPSSITAAVNASAIAATLSISKQSVELTDAQKQILGMTSADDPSASLETQVELTVRGKDQRLMLMQKLMRKQESKVLILRNMVGPEDVDDELESEITDECGKYGEVEQVVIYKEKQGEYDESETIVKIFVEFTSSQAVNTAIQSLNGRYFAGRVVKAEIYDQAAYDSKDYSG